VIPTGLDLETYRNVDGASIRQKLGWKNDTVLITVGRLAKEKNWETLLSAAKSVIAQQPGVRFVIIGDGPYREKLEKTAASAGIARQVQFTGKIPFDQVPSYLKAADLFCFASVTETQGLVTMEALAADLPVIAVNATGTRDVLEDGVQGLLTENRPEALANGVLRVVNDEALYNGFRQAARLKAEEFDIKKLASKLVSVYEIAIEAKKAGRYVPVESESVEPTRRRGELAEFE
jgi:glycosyltransferase involved in cell wall biosynthesis